MASPALASATAPMIPSVKVPEEKKLAMRAPSRAYEAVAQAIADVGNEDIIWPLPIREAMRHCTAKEAKFAVLTATGMSQVEAYNRSYDVKPGTYNCITDAHEVAARPRVSTLNGLVQSWLSQKWLLDALEVREFGLCQLFELSQTAPKPADRIKATELLLKAHGQFTDRKEIIHRDGADLDSQVELAESILTLLDASILPEPEPNPLPSHHAAAPMLGQTPQTPTVGVYCDHCAMALTPVDLAGDGDGI